MAITPPETSPCLDMVGLRGPMTNDCGMHSVLSRVHPFIRPPPSCVFISGSCFSSLFPCLRVSVAPLLALAPFLPHHLSPSRLPRFLPRPPTDTAPLTVKLYLNRQSIGFSDTDDMAPAQTLELTPEDLVAGSVSVLKFVKFQRVTGLSVRYVFWGEKRQD